MPDKVFKIIVLKKLSELLETERQFNKIRNTIHGQNEKYKRNKNRKRETNSRAEEYNEWRYMKEKESIAYQSSRRRNL